MRGWLQLRRAAGSPARPGARTAAPRARRDPDGRRRDAPRHAVVQPRPGRPARDRRPRDLRADPRPSRSDAGRAARAARARNRAPAAARRRVAVRRRPSCRRVAWWQPLTRLAVARLRQSMELCCDDWAASRLPDRMALAECLVKVGEWGVAVPARSPAGRVRGHGSTLRERVERLIDGRTPDGAARLPHGWLAAVAAARRARLRAARDASRTRAGCRPSLFRRSSAPAPPSPRRRPCSRCRRHQRVRRAPQRPADPRRPHRWSHRVARRPRRAASRHRPISANPSDPNRRRTRRPSIITMTNPLVTPRRPACVSPAASAAWRSTRRRRNRFFSSRRTGLNAASASGSSPSAGIPRSIPFVRRIPGLMARAI